MEAEMLDAADFYRGKSPSEEEIAVCPLQAGFGFSSISEHLPALMLKLGSEEIVA